MASTQTLEQETASGKWTVPVIIVAHVRFNFYCCRGLHAHRSMDLWYSQITAKPGFGDEVAKLVAVARDAAVGAPDDPSKKREPGTLEYRISRYRDVC